MSSEKTSNPEKYWLNIPEILGLEIYKGKNLKKMAKNRGKHLKNSGVEQVWNILWGEMESAAKLQSGASFNLAGQRGMEI